jgi:hypothetical protein
MAMGAIYEELIRRSFEAENETAGEHFTPREVISLMVDLLFCDDDAVLRKRGIIRTLFDPACGTGGMLSVAEGRLRELKAEATLEAHGQELNDRTYVICRSDMMVKGEAAAAASGPVVRTNALSRGRLPAARPDQARRLRENDSMTRLRATAAHTIPLRPPIRVTPGQQVQAGQRDTDWPAFVFISTDDGAGWIPDRHLDTSSDPAVVITAYDTTELATTGGEELTLIQRDDPSGWAWVRNAAGQEGWVPLRTIEPVPGQ